MASKFEAWIEWTADVELCQLLFKGLFKFPHAEPVEGRLYPNTERQRGRIPLGVPPSNAGGQGTPSGPASTRSSHTVQPPPRGKKSFAEATRRPAGAKPNQVNRGQGTGSIVGPMAGVSTGGSNNPSQRRPTGQSASTSSRPRHPKYVPFDYTAETPRQPRPNHHPIVDESGEFMYSVDLHGALWKFVILDKKRTALDTIGKYFRVVLEVQKHENGITLWAQPPLEDEGRFAQFQHRPRPRVDRELSDPVKHNLELAYDFLTHYMQETQIYTRTNRKGPNILDFFEYFLDPAFKPLRARLEPEEFGEDDEDEEEKEREASQTPPASTAASKSARGPAPAQGPPQSSVAQPPRRGNEATKPASSAAGRPATPAQRATSTAPTDSAQSTASEPKPFTSRQVKTDEDPWPYKVNAKGEPILATRDDMKDLLPGASPQELHVATVKHNDKILRQHIEEEKTRWVYDRATGKQVLWGTCVEAIKARAKAEAKKELVQTPGFVQQVKRDLWSEWCESYGMDPRDGPPKKRARARAPARAEDSDSITTTPTPVGEGPKPGNQSPVTAAAVSEGVAFAAYPSSRKSPP